MDDSKSLVEMLESLHDGTVKDDLAAGNAPLVIWKRTEETWVG